MNTKFFLYLSAPILAITLVIANFFPAIFVYCENQEKIKVITNSVKIFEEASISGNILKIAKKDENFVKTGESGEFYEIQYSTTQKGFVLKAYTVDTQNKQLEIFLDTNAVLVQDSEVFECKMEAEFVPIGMSLEKDFRVKVINGIDKSKKFTKISFKNQKDGKILTYFVETNALEVDGVSVRTVVAIMLIVACVSLFLIFYSFFKGKTKVD